MKTLLFLLIGVFLSVSFSVLFADIPDPYPRITPEVETINFTFPLMGKTIFLACPEKFITRLFPKLKKAKECQADLSNCLKVKLKHSGTIKFNFSSEKLHSVEIYSPKESPINSHIENFITWLYMKYGKGKESSLTSANGKINWVVATWKVEFGATVEMQKQGKENSPILIKIF